MPVVDLSQPFTRNYPGSPNAAAPKTAETTPPPQLTPQQHVPGIQGHLPLPTEIIPAPRRLLPDEKEVLTQAGWREGEPVPVALADALAEIRRESQTYAPPVPPDTPPLQVPEPIPLSQLPPAKQRELQQLLEAERQQRAAQPPSIPEVPGADPSINEAIRTAQQAPPIGIVDDRTARGTTVETAPWISKVAEPARTALPEGPAMCPHCGWDLKQPDPAVVTAQDKRIYLAALLAPQQFLKTYALCGGHLSVTFRSLALAEIDAVYLATNAYQTKHGLLPPAAYFALVQRYRLCLQLRRYEGGQERLDLPESLADWSLEVKEPHEKLPEIERWLASRVLVSETIVNLLGKSLAEFNWTAKKLEDNADNPDFQWAAVTPA